MIKKQRNEEDNRVPRGNDKPGGGSQIPQGQQGKKIAGEGGDKELKDEPVKKN